MKDPASTSPRATGAATPERPASAGTAKPSPLSQDSSDLSPPDADARYGSPTSSSAERRTSMTTNALFFNELEDTATVAWGQAMEAQACSLVDGSSGWQPAGTRNGSSKASAKKAVGPATHVANGSSMKHALGKRASSGGGVADSSRHRRAEAALEGAQHSKLPIKTCPAKQPVSNSGGTEQFPVIPPKSSILKTAAAVAAALAPCEAAVPSSKPFGAASYAAAASKPSQTAKPPEPAPVAGSAEPEPEQHAACAAEVVPAPQQQQELPPLQLPTEAAPAAVPEGQPVALQQEPESSSCQRAEQPPSLPVEVPLVPLYDPLPGVFSMPGMPPRPLLPHTVPSGDNALLPPLGMQHPLHPPPPFFFAPAPAPPQLQFGSFEAGELPPAPFLPPFFFAGLPPVPFAVPMPPFPPGMPAPLTPEAATELQQVMAPDAAAGQGSLPPAKAQELAVLAAAAEQQDEGSKGVPTQELAPAPGATLLEADAAAQALTAAAARADTRPSFMWMLHKALQHSAPGYLQQLHEQHAAELQHGSGVSQHCNGFDAAAALEGFREGWDRTLPRVRSGPVVPSSSLTAQPPATTEPAGVASCPPSRTNSSSGSWRSGSPSIGGSHRGNSRGRWPQHAGAATGAANAVKSGGCSMPVVVAVRAWSSEDGAEARTPKWTIASAHPQASTQQ